MYDSFKARAHLSKLNTETLRKAVPRLWIRLAEADDDFVRELAQAVLVCRLEMVTEILDFLGIPHENGFFVKDLDAGRYLTEGWRERVYERFKQSYPRPALLFYINHLAWELKTAGQPFAPAA